MSWEDEDCMEEELAVKCPECRGPIEECFCGLTGDLGELIGNDDEEEEGD